MIDDLIDDLIILVSTKNRSEIYQFFYYQENFLLNVSISCHKNLSIEEAHILWKLFFLLSFLSGPFTNHRATEEGGGNLFKYSLPLHRNLGISLNFATENLPLHIASRRTRTRNLWFASSSHQPLGYTPLKLNPLFQLINGTWISNLACNLRNIICWCT